MDAVTYPQEAVVQFITDNFIPVRISTKVNPELTEKYRVPWTPAFLVLGPDGTEYYREAGYLSPPSFLAHLSLALGRAAFEQRNFSEAAGHYGAVVEGQKESELVPEALYYLGIAKSKVSGKMDDRLATWRQLRERFPRGDWAEKASFAFD